MNVDPFQQTVPKSGVFSSDRVDMRVADEAVGDELVAWRERYEHRVARTFRVLLRVAPYKATAERLNSRISELLRTLEFYQKVRVSSTRFKVWLIRLLILY